VNITFCSGLSTQTEMSTDEAENDADGVQWVDADVTDHHGSKGSIGFRVYK
jgi:hypothetical protein